MTRLPALNQAADVSALTAFLTEVAATYSPSGDRVEAAAAMRDIGMVLASLKRHGVEPCSAVPQIEPLLLRLGELTHMCPRETVAHYGPWNPSGPRERRYTGDDREGVLIDSVRVGIPLVVRMSRELLDAMGSQPFSEEFFAELQAARYTAEKLVDVLGTVRDDVTPWYFARYIRPYFEAIQVAGESYMGAAAAHMPLYVVDLVLWKPQAADFLELLEHSRLHATPSWRELLAEADSLPESLSQLVAAELAERPGPLAERAAKELRKLFRALVTFRGRHAALARQAYTVETDVYETGSGGGTPEQLLTIVREMQSASQAIASNALKTMKVRECPYAHEAAAPPEIHDMEGCLRALRAMYASRGAASVELLRPALAPSFVFYPAGRESSLQEVYHGADGMAEFLRRQAEWTADSWWPELVDLTVGEGHAIGVIAVRCHREADQQRANFQILHRWRIEDGLIAEFRSFVSDQRAYDAFHQKPQPV